MKEHYTERGDWLDENIGSGYGSRLSGMLTKSSNVVYQEDDSHFPVAKGPNIIQQDDECASEGIPSFVAEISDILL